MLSCRTKLMPSIIISPLVDERSQSSIDSAIVSAGAFIIGLVLATIILCATVWMIRRRQQSQHKLGEQDQR